MSEYQYYEFVAVDRPLSRDEQAQLRAISSRAEISAARFVNVYHYGDLKADPHALLGRSFDAFVYVSNWGHREFALRLPRESVDEKALEPYLAAEVLELATTREHATLTFTYRDEEGGGWVDDEDAAAWMPSLLPLRAQLLRGDLAPLYVAWLRGAQEGVLSSSDEGEEVDEDALEPPVPAGLRDPSAALQSLVEFLDVDSDLFAAAAEASPDAESDALDRRALGAWLAKRPAADKDAWLTRVAAGEGARVEAELRQAFRAATAPARGARTAKRRTLAEIKARARALAEERARRKAADAERARVASERAAAAAREQRLAALAGRTQGAWAKVESLVEQQKGSSYEEAIALLLDLRALAEREGATADFAARIEALRARHPKKPALHRRLAAARLA